MTYCGSCHQYVVSCPHQPQELPERPWKVQLALAFMILVLAYVAGGVWGLW